MGRGSEGFHSAHGADSAVCAQSTLSRTCISLSQSSFSALSPHPPLLWSQGYRLEMLRFLFRLQRRWWESSVGVWMPLKMQRRFWLLPECRKGHWPMRVQLQKGPLPDESVQALGVSSPSPAFSRGEQEPGLSSTGQGFRRARGAGQFPNPSHFLATLRAWSSALLDLPPFMASSQGFSRAGAG